jgi:hypothetical protein
MSLLGGITYTPMAESQLSRRRIDKSDVEYVLVNCTSSQVKGSTEEIRGTLVNGQLLVVRIERGTRPIKVVGVIAP